MVTHRATVLFHDGALIANAGHTSESDGGIAAAADRIFVSLQDGSLVSFGK